MLRWKEVFKRLISGEAFKEDWIGQVFRPRSDSCEREEGRRQNWVGKTQTMMQI